MGEQQLQNLDAPFWTIDQAALHFGVTRRTIRRYIQDGLKTWYTDEWLRPADVIDEYIRRHDAERAHRATTR